MSEQHTAENDAPWALPFPDLTTETIRRIDTELAATQANRDLLAREALCLTCGERGVHVHVIPPGSTEEGNDGGR